MYIENKIVEKAREFASRKQLEGVNELGILVFIYNNCNVCDQVVKSLICQQNKSYVYRDIRVLRFASSIKGLREQKFKYPYLYVLVDLKSDITLENIKAARSCCGDSDSFYSHVINSQ